MLSVLTLGLLMGMRHALEADHLAAVAALGTPGGTPATLAFRGAVWGLGHTTTLLMVGGTCLILSTTIPPHTSQWLERLVGLMLLAMAADMFRRLRKGRVHIHVHQHGGGVVHLHAHRHRANEAYDPAHHHHTHAPRSSGRALVVGMVHGMAGSAGLLLVTLQAVHSISSGLLYIAVFGIGSMLGMAVLSVAIAAPFRFASRAMTHSYATLEALIGLTTAALGIWIMAR